MGILEILVIWFESQIEIYLMIFEKHILPKNVMPDITKALSIFSSQTVCLWKNKLLN